MIMKTFFISIGFLIVLTLLAGAGYAVWQRGKQMSQTPTRFPIKTETHSDRLSSSTITQEAKPTPSSQSNWKTFHNEKYGLEVMYPEYMLVTGPEIYGPDGTTLIQAQFLLLIRDQKYINRVEGEWPGLVISNFSYGDPGVEATVFKSEYPKIDGEGVKIHFQRNGQTISALCFFDQNGTTIDVCNNILSSFKFEKDQKNY